MGMFNLSLPVEDTEKKIDEPVVSDITGGVVDSKDTTTDAVIAGTTGDAVEDPKQKTIVLDGPLSQIYTQALNIAYAKESMGMMLGVYNELNKKPSDSNEPDDSYVYVINADDLDTNMLIQSSECLRVASTSGKYKNIILAIESHGNIGSKMQLLSEMGNALGAQVCFNRNGAIQSVLNALKKD